MPAAPRPDMRRIVPHLEIRSSRPSFTPRQIPGRVRDLYGRTAVARFRPLWRRSSAACTTARCPPEEAIVLRLADCHLPQHGWGTLTLTRAAPHTAKAWTGTGTSHEQHGLKHRPESPSRPSLPPCSTPTSIHAQMKQAH